MNLFNKKSNVVDLINNNQFLYSQCETDGFWIATDSSEQYQEHLKTMPKNWYYRHNTVHYNINSRRYRTKEFEDIDWANSIVILGCSQVYGVGVDESHTIGHFLQEMTGKFVVNLGIPGGSNNLILNNSMILSAGYPTPLAVIHMYTEVKRFAYYCDNSVHNHGSWTLKERDPFMVSWSEDESNADVHTLMASKTINQVWKHKTKLIEATNYESTHKLLDCMMPRTPVFKEYARDRMHYGFKTNKMIAKQLANKL